MSRHVRYRIYLSRQPPLEDWVFAVDVSQPKVGLISLHQSLEKRQSPVEILPVLEDISYSLD